MNASPEYRTFVHHYRNLKTSLDANTVVAIAFAVGLLTPEEHEKATNMYLSNGERLEIFLKAIGRRIAENPEAFHTFVREVLKGEPAFQHLVEKLKSMLP